MIPGGPKPKGDNAKLFEEFSDFCRTEFQYLMGVNDYNIELIDSTGLSQINAYSCIEIITNIENNITFHFFDYLRKFVNQSLKREHDVILNSLQGKEKQLKSKELRKELAEVKNDLINNTYCSNIKYHAWINEIKYKILPGVPIISYESDVSLRPQKYIKYMITKDKKQYYDDIEG